MEANRFFSYKKSLRGFNVYFPVEFVSLFKSIFKTAKFNSSLKCWEVGPRGEPRIKDFLEQCQKLSGVFEELEAARLSEEEIKTIEERLENVRSCVVHKIDEINTEIKNKKSAATLCAEIENTRALLVKYEEQLDAAKKERIRANAYLQAERERVDALLSSVIDLLKLKGVVLSTFAKYHAQVGSTAHAMFDEAQAEFRLARRALRKHGLGLKALDYLSDANFNRVDRDGVKYMPHNAWYDVYEIKDED